MTAEKITGGTRRLKFTSELRALTGHKSAILLVSFVLRFLPTRTMEDRSLFQALLGDGRFLIALTGMALLASGGFAIFQSLTGQLLPHDVQAIGMDAASLAHRATPNLVRFMFHDRVAFGGTLLAIGMAYCWLVDFPLSAGAAWAWWTLAISGAFGFISFLSYLGYGYLDTWHGIATLFLLPVFVAGMWRAQRLVPGPLDLSLIWKPSARAESRPAALGRALLLFIGFGLIAAGLTILFVGMTRVFVPQDIVFIGLSPASLRGVSPVLVPLIAHDRAGFGGGLLSFGIILSMMMRHAPLSRSLVELVALMGLSGFGCAVGVHFAVGYTDLFHLLPAYLGFVIFLVSVALLTSGVGRGKALSASGRQ